MSQTQAGKNKTRETMIRKHGSYENYLAYMRQIAKDGGKNGKGHKFAHGKVDPSTKKRIET